MCNIFIVGNPNVGKSTLFNSLTKSNEHTGNFHGVTVEEKSKSVKFEGKEYVFFDLPGIQSLNTFSFEEEITKKFLLKQTDKVIMITDANSLRKNLYLCQQLNELGINYKLVINNYDYFKKHNNQLNLKKLQEELNQEILIVNAKKAKLNSNFITFNGVTYKEFSYINKYVKIVQSRYDLSKEIIVLALNGVFSNLNEEQINFIKSLFPSIIKDRYSHIDNILNKCLKLDKKYVYGSSKLDKFLLNPVVSCVGFFLTFFVSFYAIFFVLGPWIGAIEEKVLKLLFINPIMNFICMLTDNVWLIEFFRSGVFNSILTVISFVPQVTLMFVFLSILEDSGIISRLAYVFDDFLNVFGLNGKALYNMLMGLGCNTMSTTATRNLNEKNLRIKSAIINPYISCMARLPVYVLIASAFFGKKTFFVVVGLYVLGFIVALFMSYVLNKTILKSKSNELLIEFPPLKSIDIKHISKVAKSNAIDFFKRVFTIILCMGIIVWILTHTKLNLQYTDNLSHSILFILAEKISFVFAPIGLKNSGVVCALFVGVLAKEMIVSTISICNNTSSQQALVKSLILSTSVVNFSLASAVSFLIFSLLYCPCFSNLAVIKKETGKFYMWFSLISQFTIAYVLCFVVYQALTKGFVFAMLAFVIIAIIMMALIYLIKKVKHNKCLTCGKCKL